MRFKENFFLNLIVLIAGTVLTSFYLFPIGFRGLPPTLNTKQILAVVGVMLFAYKSLHGRSFEVYKGTLVSFVIACVFSAWCYLSVSLNNTDDLSYATYFVSFSVWLAGA